jgi:LysM repeat protein
MFVMSQVLVIVGCMSMYAINESAVNQSVVERGTGNPVAFSPRPFLRLVAPPVRSSGRNSRAVFRRRRLAVLLMAVALVLAAKTLVGGSQPALETSRAESVALAAVSGTDAPGSYVVKRGDTLWAIARQLQPGGDVRPVVDRLASLRREEPLRVGERIALP